MKSNLSILIVDDHDTIVSGLKYELNEKFENINLSVADNTDKAFSLCTKNNYDIAIIDVSFKNEQNSDGICLVTKLKQSYPNIKLICYTSFADRIKYINLLIEAGVDAIISKVDGNFYIKYAINELLNNGNSPFYSKEVLNVIEQSDKKNKTQIHISSREKEIIVLLRQHLKYKQIADRLCLSKNTIDSHAKNLYIKFNVHKVSELLDKTKDHL